MAKAKFNDGRKVVLKLSHEEAQFLVDVLANVGGGIETRRRYQESISLALSQIGFDFGDNCDLEGSIRFTRA